MEIENLNLMLDHAAKEMDLPRDVLVKAIEDAIETAAHKIFGGDRELEANFNSETGSVDLLQFMAVVDEIDDPDREITLDQAKLVDPDAEVGDELGFQIFYLEKDKDKADAEDKKHGDILGIKQARSSFGRIAAQTAKQVIKQRIREAERSRVFDEYKDRQGELVTGRARRFERGNVIVALPRAEGILPAREQMHRESYRAGDRVQAFVKEVRSDSRGPQIILSRTDPGLIYKLFEMEVPEIYEGIVRIVAVAREPGERTKIAVASRDPDVDPVGACVGMKGSRVQAIIRELRGEKIDIIEYSEDLVTFAQSALAPAKITRVSVHHGGDRPHLDVIVEDEQLSLAIGKRGQNVRLAAELIGCKIDIKSESDVKDEVADALARMLQGAFSQEAGPAVSLTDEIDLSTVPGVGAKTAIDLKEAGFTTLQTLLDAASEDLQQVDGVGPKTAQAILNWAQERAAKVGGEGEAAGVAIAMPATTGGTTMNDQDFFAALSKALGESEEQARQAEEMALEAEADRTNGEDGSDPDGSGQG